MKCLSICQPYAELIIDGRKKHSILFEIFSDKGSGTLIRK